jgi:hypothetical protein
MIRNWYTVTVRIEMEIAIRGVDEADARKRAMEQGQGLTGRYAPVNHHEVVRVELWKKGEEGE